MECRGIAGNPLDRKNFELICENMGEVVQYFAIVNEDRFYQLPNILLKTILKKEDLEC